MESKATFNVIMQQLVNEQAERFAPISGRGTRIHEVVISDRHGPVFSFKQSVAEYCQTLQAAPMQAGQLETIEESVKRELSLSDDLAPVELERLRRRFAFANHPDRAKHVSAEDALERMKLGNQMIDDALRQARLRSRHPEASSETLSRW